MTSNLDSFVINRSEIISNFKSGIENNTFRGKLLALWGSFDRFNRDLVENNYSNICKVTDLKEDDIFKNIFTKIDKNIFFSFIKDRQRTIEARQGKNDDGIGGVYNIKYKKVYHWKAKENFGEFIEIIRTIVNNTDHGEKNLISDINIELLEKISIVFQIFLKELYKEFLIIE